MASSVIGVPSYFLVVPWMFPTLRPDGTMNPQGWQEKVLFNLSCSKGSAPMVAASVKHCMITFDHVSWCSTLLDDISWYLITLNGIWHGIWHDIWQRKLKNQSETDLISQSDLYLDVPEKKHAMIKKWCVATRRWKPGKHEPPFPAASSWETPEKYRNKT